MRRLLLTILLASTICSISLGANRYVSKSGSDSNDGSSWAQAWLTIQKVNASVTASDSVFFSTGIWNDTTLHAIGGGYGTETIYACSSLAVTNGAGQHHFARILGGTPITTWTQVGATNVWIATYTPKITNPPLFQGRTNLILRVADSASVNSAGEYWNGNGRFVVWCHSNVNPNTVEIVAGERFNTETRRSGTHQSHIKFIGLSFEYSFGKGISCMQYGDEIQSDSIFIERCYFNQVAASGGTNTAHINFMSSGVADDGADYVSVLACSLGNAYTWNGADDAATQTISGNNASSISMYINRYSVIDSCIFSSTSWSAQGTIDFKAGYGGGAWQEYDTIRNCIFTTNAQAAIWIYNHCRYVSFYGNIVNGPRNGVEFDYGGGEWSGSPGYNEIFNNTFIGNDQTGQANYSFYRAISNQGYGYTHVQYNNSIKYNVFYSELASTRASIDSIRFYDPALIDSNMYYSTGTIAFYSPYTTSQTQSWWQTTSGLDVNSSFSTNPNLNNIGAGDYSRPAASGEMNRTYGYQTFTIFGAWQPSAPAEYKRIRMKVR